MSILPRQSYTRYYCGNGRYSSNGRRSGCRNNSFSNWGRWIVLAIILLGAIFIFFAFACITARRRRRQGMTPFRGTGWAAGRPPPGHGPAQYTGAQPPPNYNTQAGYDQQPAGAPAYGPPQNQNYYGNGGANQSYFGGQQSGVELQQPNNSYQPPRGGEQVYSPPSGPPPGKDGIIR